MTKTTERIIVYGCDTAQPLWYHKYRETLDSSVNQIFTCAETDVVHEYEVKGIYFIGRYLKNAENSNANKELTRDEVYHLSRDIKRILSIWEQEGSGNGFAEKGDSHAAQAIEAATSFGQHPGTPIFFAYEGGTGTDLEEVVYPYFRAVVRRFRNPELNPKGYKVGVYSSGKVCQRLMTAPESSGYKVDYAFLAGRPRDADYSRCDSWCIRQGCDSFRIDGDLDLDVDWIETNGSLKSVDDIAWRHRFGGNWYERPDDVENHYDDCLFSGCDYSHKEPHKYADLTADDDITHTETCAKCGHTRTTRHTYGPWKDKGNGTHVCTCMECGHQRTEAHIKSYTSNGASGHTVTCTKQGCSYSKTEAHIKRYTNNGASGHTVICTKQGCNYSKTEAHSMTSWSDCGDGRHKRTCSKCGYVEYSGHVYNEWEDNGTTHKRTCKTAGCGYTQTEAHTYGSWVKLDNDRHRRTCSKCGSVQTKNHGGVWVCTPDKLGHSKHCATCGADLEEIHTIVNGTCTKCGYTGGGINPADSIGDENE